MLLVLYEVYRSCNILYNLSYIAITIVRLPFFNTDKPFIQNVTGVPYPVCERSQVTLHCDATGNPSPFVAWISAIGTVLQHSTNVTSYTISQVMRNDEGNYTCKASNTVGEDIDSTGILDVQCRFLPVPRTYLDTGYLNESESSDLTCSSELIVEYECSIEYSYNN